MPYNIDQVKTKTVSNVRVYTGSVMVDFTDGSALEVYTGPSGELCHEYLTYHQRQTDADQS